ncbi:MAG: hypothetical protein ABSF09_09755, partial [Candidatus Bathyarchaeia archaeon]
MQSVRTDLREARRQFDELNKKFAALAEMTKRGSGRQVPTPHIDGPSPSYLNRYVPLMTALVTSLGFFIGEILTATLGIAYSTSTGIFPVWRALLLLASFTMIL